MNYAINWNPCCFRDGVIQELKWCARKHYLLTLEDEGGKRYLKEASVCRGRLRKNRDKVIAWAELPDVYRG